MTGIVAMLDGRDWTAIAHELEQDGFSILSTASSAEGRIVAAGSLADRGDLPGALKLMTKGAEVPKKVRDHHLRQWYVLGDLYDRSGDVIKARRFFSLVAENDREFADVAERLRTLGR